MTTAPPGHRIPCEASVLLLVWPAVAWTAACQAPKISGNQWLICPTAVAASRKRDALCFDPGRGPPARLRRGHARGPGPRRRPLCARTWPRLEPATIAGFAGRPYAEVAVDVIRPFTGDAIADADLARMAREAYGTFRHPAVAPLTQLGAKTVHARAVSRADAGLQRRGHAASGAADGPCAGGARRAPHHRRRHLGRHRRRRGRGLPRPRPGRCHRAVPARPHLRRAAAHDDHGGGRQRPCARHRRHVRRLPGDGERHVQSRAPFATACACPASTRSTGRGSWRRRSITSPPRWRSARRTAKWPSPCRPAISATSMPATWRSA